jgi:septal ring factor EnvC (AmiA/AmiB activator)
MMCGKTVLLVLLSVLPWASWGQSEPSLLGNLDRLGILLNSIEQTNNEQQRQLQALSEQLENSGNELQNSNNQILISGQAIADLRSISETQGEYLNSLQFQLEQRRLISEAQLSYTKRLQTKSKVLSVSLIVGIPAAIAGTAWLTWRICN